MKIYIFHSLDTQMETSKIKKREEDGEFLYLLFVSNAQRNTLKVNSNLTF